MALFVISSSPRPRPTAWRCEDVHPRGAPLPCMAASGMVRLGGPYLNGDGDPIGSLVIVEADSQTRGAHTFMKD